MKLLNAIIDSNVYISLAAVFLTIETQIQLEMKPQWHPYLFIIFFATFFEYNIHRFITVITNNQTLNSDNHIWIKKNLKLYYVLVMISIIGFIYACTLAKKEVLIALIPIAVLTLFYSLPKFGNKKNIFRLREIPYLKIFLIAFVWSLSTILLPIIQTELSFNKSNIILMLLERFFFVFAITIPFDVRDIDVDKKAGLKTIPLLLNEKKSLLISYISLFIFFSISFIHYQKLNYWFIIIPIIISTISTFMFLKIKKIRNLHYYHYGILDGTMLFQGVLVFMFYYFYK